MQELGHAIRTARQAQGLTQAELAASVGLSRATLNKLESGLGELGIRKILRVLDLLDIALVPERRARPRRPDYVRMACSMANVSFKDALAEEELIAALVKGKVPPGRSPHLRVLLEEAPVALLRGLATEAARWMSRDKLQRNVARLARDVGSSRGTGQWLMMTE